MTSSEIDQAGKIIQEQGLRVPMRDGVVLRADVYRPDGEGLHPVLLLRIPYDKRVAQTCRERFKRSICSWPPVKTLPASG